MNVNFVSDNKGYGIHNNTSNGLSDKNVPKPAILVLDGKSYAPGELIAQFGLFLTADAVLGSVEKGVLSLDSEKDKERIEFLRKYGDNNRAYKEVKNLPLTTFSNGGIVTGAGASQTLNQTSKEVNKNLVAKTMHYMELKQKLFKVDGTQKKEIEEAELNEFNELAKELNLS